MMRPQARSAAIWSRIFHKAFSSSRTFRLSPRPRRWMPPSASSCFRSYSGRGRSGLRSARSNLDPDSAGLLDRLIETALRCPTANIEIAGHTDNRWRECRQPGAFRKACAGGHGLSGQGRIARGQIHGARLWQHPAGVDQRYDEGKAQNRRIEFVVKE